MGGEKLPLREEVGAKEERRLEGEELRRRGVQAMEVSEVVCSLEIFVTKCLATKMLWRKQKNSHAERAPSGNFFAAARLEAHKVSSRHSTAPPMATIVDYSWTLSAQFFLKKIKLFKTFFFSLWDSKLVVLVTNFYPLLSKQFLVLNLNLHFLVGIANFMHFLPIS